MLMLVDRLGVGGSEYSTLELVRELAIMGHRVGVATAGGPLEAEFQRAGAAVHLLGGDGRAGVQGTEGWARKLADLVLKRGYRYLDVQMPRSLAPGTRAAALTGIPLFITVRGTYYHREQLRRSAVAAARVIVNSRSLVPWVAGLVDPVRITVIPSGISLPPGPAVAPSTSPTPVIACLARLAGRKLPVALALLGALEVLARQGVAFTATIAGPAGNYSEVRSLTATVNRAAGREAVTVCGTIPRLRLADFWRGGTVAVASGRAAVEALGHGVPVLAAGEEGYFGPVTTDNLVAAADSCFGDHAGPIQVTAGAFVRDLAAILPGTAGDHRPDHAVQEYLRRYHDPWRVALETCRLFQICGG